IASPSTTSARLSDLTETRQAQPNYAQYYYGPYRRHVRRVYRRAFRRAYYGYPYYYGGYYRPYSYGGYYNPYTYGGYYRPYSYGGYIVRTNFRPLSACASSVSSCIRSQGKA